MLGHQRTAARFLSRLLERQPQDLDLDIRPLRGGLESAAVQRVTARYRDEKGRAHVFRVVAKLVEGPARREADVYVRILAPYVAGLVPQFLGMQAQTHKSAVIYLAMVQRIRAWPWGESSAVGSLLQRVAELHGHKGLPPNAIPSWDYEAELTSSAASTVDLLETLRGRHEFAPLLRGLPHLRRVVAALPALRRQLLSSSLFGSGFIHGDLHPGNVILASRRGREEPILIDWGRARIGSPLEDVSSWLQSLGHWEPVARRRHDTLLATYLQARGLKPRLTPELRRDYWLATASNALSGALRYQLWAASQGPPRGRPRALHIAHKWLRTLRNVADEWSGRAA